MTETTNLNISHWTAAQSQPEVTVNEGSDIFDGLADALVHNTATDADYTLTTTGTPPYEWQHLVIQITDTGVVLTTGRNIVCPVYTRAYILANATAQTITLKTPSGSGIAVANTKTAFLRCDGTNVVRISADF